MIRRPDAEGQAITGLSRGLNVWVGLDQLGGEVVGRLNRWFQPDAVGRELGMANQLLPQLFLPHALGDMTAPSSGAPAGEAVQAIATAVATLLGSELGRQALARSDYDLLTVHLWLVIDIDATEAAHLGRWVARLQGQLAALSVQFRTFVLLRNLSWQRSAEQEAAVSQRIRALVDETTGPDRSGEGRTMVFVVSDRNAIGGLSTPRDTTQLIHQFCDVVLLADLARNAGQGADFSFNPPHSDIDLPWDHRPVFASLAADAFVWDGVGIARRNAEQRRHALLRELSSTVSTSFQPTPPTLPELIPTEAVRWPEVRLPSWSPRLSQSAIEAFGESQAVLDNWRARATRWRHDMLVTHQDARVGIDRRAAVSIEGYTTELDDRTRTVLSNEGTRGLFDPVRRLLERATSDLAVVRRDLPPLPPIMTRDGPTDDRDEAPAIDSPTEVVAGKDRRVVAQLERKVNAPLLTIVATLTFLFLWGWTVYAAHRLLAWDPPANLAASDDGAKGLRSALNSFRNTRLPDIRDALPTMPQVMIWSAVAYALIIGLVLVVIVWRQRVALEQAWGLVYRAARSWRTDAQQRLTADLRVREVRAAHAVVERLQTEVQERLRRLDVLQRHLARAGTPADHADPAITAYVMPQIPPPPNLTDVQINQIAMAFRRHQHDDPAFRVEPERMSQRLFEIAAAIASDPRPDLVNDIPSLRLRVANTVPPRGAVRTQQPILEPLDDELAQQQFGQYAAVPGQVTAQLTAIGRALVATPTADRFYGVTILSGLNARRILGRAIELAADPPTRSAEPGDEVEQGLSDHAEPITSTDTPDDSAPAVIVPPDTSAVQVTSAKGLSSLAGMPTPSGTPPTSESTGPADPATSALVGLSASDVSHELGDTSGAARASGREGDAPGSLNGHGADDEAPGSGIATGVRPLVSGAPTLQEPDDDAPPGPRAFRIRQRGSRFRPGPSVTGDRDEESDSDPILVTEKEQS